MQYTFYPISQEVKVTGQQNLVIEAKRLVPGLFSFSGKVLPE